MTVLSRRGPVDRLQQQLFGRRGAITWRDLIAANLGVAGTTFVLTLLSGAGIAVGFLGGTIVTGLLNWGAIFLQVRARSSAELARDSVVFELIRAWDETDRLREHLGQAPLPHRSLDDIRLNREQSEVPTP
jgi:hypothetical protein